MPALPGRLGRRTRRRVAGSPHASHRQRERLAQGLGGSPSERIIPRIKRCMDLLYADPFWGPRADSPGNVSVNSEAGAGARRAGLRSARPAGGGFSALLSAAGQFCVCCGRPAHAGRDATKAPRAGGGDRHGSKFERLLSCGQVSGGPQPQLPWHSSPHPAGRAGICS
jgi:hypothetical protein